MDCKSVQELILTDFIDGQMADSLKGLIDQHLKQCHDCKAYLSEVKNQAVNPFINLIKEVPDVVLWARIKQNIQEEQDQLLEKNLQPNVWERFRALVLVPRPAFALATFLTMIFMVGSMGQLFLSKPALKINGPDQVAYLSSLVDEPISISAGAESPTPIEKYFL